MFNILQCYLQKNLKKEELNMRDTLFISHANPENNYFAAWLATKLRLLGYKVWVDVKDLKPGQYFNRDFEKAIREDAIRFLAVVSNDYITKSNKDDTGVMNEILCARTIKDVDGFIIPLHYGNSDYNDFTVGLRGRLAVPFSENWADGLHELVSYLEEANIPKSHQQESVIQFWHEAQKIKSDPIAKEEKYLTNWFPANLPEYVYVHQPEALIEKDFVLMPFTYIREADRLISFTSTETFNSYSKLVSSYPIATDKFYENETLKIDEKFELKEPNKKLVKLLNKIFKSHLIKSHLRIYQQANHKEVFYFPYSPENRKQVNLKQVGKSRRSVIGGTSDFTWHFGISHSASTFPYPNFKIFYHLIFTDDKGKHLKPEDQRELRRSVPSDWYNRKWLETLLAMMLKVAKFDRNNQIRIEVDTNLCMTVDILPIEIISEIGYKEPTNELETRILP